MQLRRTRRPWFGPKRIFGWGWRVASWQGWVVTVIVLGLILGAQAVWPGGRARPAAIGLLAVYLVIIVLTGDPPGGPRRRGRDNEQVGG